MPEFDQINLDLDSLEREQVRGVPKKKAPYVVKIGGKPIPFRDPMDIDAAILMIMEETPGRFFRATLEDDNYEHVIGVFNTPGGLSGLQLRALMQGYRHYYGIDDMGNAVGSLR